MLERLQTHARRQVSLRFNPQGSSVMVTESPLQTDRKTESTRDFKSLLNLHRVSMEARLRSSSSLFMEPKYRRLAKARQHEMSKLQIEVDTVGVSSDSVISKVTVYSLRIRSRVRVGDTGEWLLQKRFSEFSLLRLKLLQMVRDWEATAMDDSPEVLIMSNSLRKPFDPHFPRKHMRSDSPAIIRERRRGLQQFVLKVLATYADLSVFLLRNQKWSSMDSHANLWRICLFIEDSLEFPQTQKDADRSQAGAILAIEDVEPQDHDESATCCICLSTAQSSSDVPEIESPMVQLPCSHQFHEDCVIDWYNTSRSCPLCRQTSA